MSPNGATQSRQGKQWQLHSGSVPVVVHAIPRLYVVRLELAVHRLSASVSSACVQVCSRPPCHARTRTRVAIPPCP